MKDLAKTKSPAKRVLGCLPRECSVKRVKTNPEYTLRISITRQLSATHTRQALGEISDAWGGRTRVQVWLAMARARDRVCSARELESAARLD